jgi:hypothetical protein
MPRVELKFPLKGIDKGWSNSEQPPVTSPDLDNVRAIDVRSNRIRGGQRPGLKRWAKGIKIGTNFNPIVAMCTVDSQGD